MKRLTTCRTFIANFLARMSLFFFSLFAILLLCVSCATVPKNPPLVNLLLEGKKDELDAMLTDENVHTRDKDGQPLLHLAAKQNDVEIVDILLKKGAKIDGLDATGKTPLLVALERRSLDVVGFLAGQDANIFIEDSQGTSSFSYAKEVALLAHILNSKTINQKNVDGKTPLHLAVQDYDVGLTRQILDLGLPPIGLKVGGDSLLSIAYARPEKKRSSDNSIPFVACRSGATL